MKYPESFSSPVIDAAVNISRDLQTDLYLVGGAVRDMLMDRFTGKDIDFVIESDFFIPVTSALTKSLNATLIPWHNNHRRLSARRGASAVCTIDIARMQNSSISKDLQQRDFSINAMAINVRSLVPGKPLSILDPYAGKKDIRSRLIRSISNEAFNRDPLRMLRAFRFCRQLDFSVDPDTAALIRKKAQLLKNVSQERINREFFTMLHYPNTSDTLETLYETGLLNELLNGEKIKECLTACPAELLTGHPSRFATLNAVESLLHDPPGDMFAYRTWLSDQLEESIEEAVSRRSLLMFAALCRDMAAQSPGLPPGSIDPCIDNSCRAASIAAAASQDMKLGKKAQTILTSALAHTDQFMQLSRLAPGKYDHAAKRFLKDSEAAAVETIVLSLAKTALLQKKTHPEENQSITGKAAAYCCNLLASPAAAGRYTPLLSGSDVKRITGIASGPRIGALLNTLHEKERTGEIRTRTEAAAWVKQHVKSQ